MEGPAQPVFAAAQVESWLEGPAAAAGPGGFCWRSQECCQLYLTFAEKARDGKKWPDTLHFPQGRLALRERHPSAALWHSLCDTVVQPSLLRPASSRSLTLDSNAACAFLRDVQPAPGYFGNHKRHRANYNAGLCPVKDHLKAIKSARFWQLRFTSIPQLTGLLTVKVHSVRQSWS